MLTIGDKIEEFEILEVLGEGATGCVYKSRHPVLGHFVAIKVLKLDEHSEKRLERFRREARLASTLDHSNIAKPLKFGASNGLPFIVYQFAEGQNLADQIKNGKTFSNEEIVQIILQLCAALEHAHGHEIIHRDIKPSNIILNEQGRLLLLDFGASIAYDAHEQNQRLTATSELIGTPTYMSPEQCTGKPLDSRSDLYSTGCILYELLQGGPPFSANNAMEMMLKHTSAPVPEITSARPEGLKEIALRLLSKSPELRAENTTSLMHELRTADTVSSTTSVLSKKHKVKTSIAMLMISLIAIGIVAVCAATKQNQASVDSALTPEEEKSLKKMDLALNGGNVEEATFVFRNKLASTSSKKLEVLLAQLALQLEGRGEFAKARKINLALIHATKQREGETLELAEPLQRFCWNDINRDTCDRDTLHFAQLLKSIADKHQTKFGKQKKKGICDFQNLATNSRILWARTKAKVTPQDPNVAQLFKDAAQALEKSDICTSERMCIEFWLPYSRWLLVSANDPANATKYLEKAINGATLALERKSPALPPGVRLEICSLAQEPKVNLSDEQIHKIERICAGLENSPSAGQYYCSMAAIYRRKDPEKAQSILLAALPNLPKDIARAAVLHQLIITNNQDSSSGRELSYATEALECVLNSPVFAPVSLATSYKVIGDCYCRKNNTKEALRNYELSLETIAKVRNAEELECLLPTHISSLMGAALAAYQLHDATKVSLYMDECSKQIPKLKVTDSTRYLVERFHIYEDELKIPSAKPSV